MDILQPSLQKKRPQLLQACPHFLQQCHTELLALCEWEVFSHPRYSPDISPPDFDLFPRIKELLRGRRFEDLLELNTFVADVIRDINNIVLLVDT